MEVEAKAVTRNNDKKQQKIWAIVLACLAVLIVGLVIAIVVVAVNRGESSTQQSEEATQEDASNGDAAMEIYYNTTDEINNTINEIPVENTNRILALYRHYLEKVEDETAKAMLMLDYVNIEMNYDPNKEKGEEIMTAALTMDEILKTSDSAATILNIASYYGKSDIYDRYEQILKERMTAEGIDMGMETEG